MMKKVGGEDEEELVGGFELPSTLFKLFTSPFAWHLAIPTLPYLLLRDFFILFFLVQAID